jgi:hypothetical protein
MTTEHVTNAIFERVGPAVAEKLPPWPLDCRTDCCNEPRDCGMVRAGIGYQCKEGDACGAYYHPGDEHFDEIDKFMRALEAAVDAETLREAETATADLPARLFTKGVVDDVVDAIWLKNRGAS